MRRSILGLAVLLACGLVEPTAADELKASKRFSGTDIAFDLLGPYWNVTLSVTGPNGYHASVFSKHGSPLLNLRKGGDLADGVYTYQLTAATDQVVEVAQEGIDNGRGPDAGPAYKGASTTGTFLVRRGAIVPQEALPQFE